LLLHIVGAFASSLVCAVRRADVLYDI
jgi:hypothetical protein